MALTARALDESWLDDLVVLARDFLAESAWDWQFDEDHARQRLRGFIHSQDADVLGIVCDDSGLVAWATVLASPDFTVEPIAFVAKFYVARPARGTWAGRMLVEAIVRWANVKGAAAVFATSTAGIGENRQFENLLAKKGFVHDGPTLVRVMESNDG